MSDREAFEKWACTLNKVPTAWEGWQAALQHAGQKGERHDWQVVHNGVWESVYKCDKCGKTVTENTDGQDKPIFGCAAPQPAVPDGWIKVMRGMAEYAECNDPRNPYLPQAQALLSAGKESV